MGDRSDLPVLLFAPGLGRSPKNTVEAVAGALAGTIDTTTPAVVVPREEDGLTAPKGLRVGPIIVSNDEPLLQTFELDYLRFIEPESKVGGPPVGPGLTRTIAYAVTGLLALVRAMNNPGKGPKTKFVLLLLMVGVLLLTTVAVLGVLASLEGVGIDLGTDVETWLGASIPIVLLGGWAAVRRNVLELSAFVQRMVAFVENDGSIAATAAGRLDTAIDGLREAGWGGPIHTVGFSFGALVLYNAFTPKTSWLMPRTVDDPASLTTLGLPLDIVLMYKPSYTADRCPRFADARWLNVFTPNDLLSSNLMTGDTFGHDQDMVDTGGMTPESVTYMDRPLTLLGLARTGQAHTSYWGSPDEANAFSGLAELFVPLPAAPMVDA